MTVETLENGFLINVFLSKTNPALLVSILEAFEELGLSVMEASASCADSFCLEAFGGEVRRNLYISYQVKSFFNYIYIYICCNYNGDKKYLFSIQ